MLACPVSGRKSFIRMNSAPRPLLARRFGAMLYDLLVLAALWMVTAALCLAVTTGHMDVQHPPWWQRLALLAVTTAYFAWSWHRGGQTIGMRAWRLSLRDGHGGRVSIRLALVRVLLASLSLALAGAGFWWALLDHEHLTAHDRLCNTRMVLLD